MPAGQIGRRVLSELLAPEFSVRVLTRQPERLSESVLTEAQVHRGSVQDPEALRRALDGVEALFWNIPPGPGDTQDPERYTEALAQTAAAAIRAAGTPRVVAISPYDDVPLGPGLEPRSSDIAQILSDSGAAVRYLRPGFYMENLLCHAQSIEEQGTFWFPVAADAPIPMIAATDVADAALKWLARSWTGALSVDLPVADEISFAQAADWMEQALDRPIRYFECAANQYLAMSAARGSNPDYSRAIVGFLIRLAEVQDTNPRGPVVAAAGTRLRIWIRNELLPRIRSRDWNCGRQAGCTCHTG
jgi:uncharacterized protein YbjT (DUF2867 family)